MAKTIRPPKRLILQPPLVPVIDVVFNLLTEVKLKYIVNAFDAVVAAQFTNIQFQCPTYSRE